MNHIKSSRFLMFKSVLSSARYETYDFDDYSFQQLHIKVVNLSIKVPDDIVPRRCYFTISYS